MILFDSEKTSVVIGGFLYFFVMVFFAKRAEPQEEYPCGSFSGQL